MIWRYFVVGLGEVIPGLVLGIFGLLYLFGLPVLVSTLIDEYYKKTNQRDSRGFLKESDLSSIMGIWVAINTIILLTILLGFLKVSRG